jgi:hypothetical protein
VRRRGGSFASPNRGIARSTRDRNGEAIRNGVSNYAWPGDSEFVDEKRARSKA